MKKFGHLCLVHEILRHIHLPGGFRTQFMTFGHRPHATPAHIMSTDQNNCDRIPPFSVSSGAWPPTSSATTPRTRCAEQGRLIHAVMSDCMFKSFAFAFPPWGSAQQPLFIDMKNSIGAPPHFYGKHHILHI